MAAERPQRWPETRDFRGGTIKFDDDDKPAFYGRWLAFSGVLIAWGGQEGLDAPVRS